VELHLREDLSEIIHYNRPELPIRFAETKLSFFDRHATGCHWHHDFEFLWPMEESITYSVNGKVMQIEKGMGIFVNSGRLHYGFSEEKREGRHRFIVIDPGLLMDNLLISTRLMLPLINGGDYRIFDPRRPEDKAILDRLSLMYEIGIHAKPGYELELLGHFALLAADLCRENAVPTTLSVRDQESIKQMLTYIQDHLTEKLTVPEIARAGAVCQSKCNRLFKAVLKQTPVQYLQSARIKKAAKLLTDDRLSITEIALECGFASVNYFIETFRQLHGMTPLLYRKTIMKAGTERKPIAGA